jgi:hypothetical protein
VYECFSHAGKEFQGEESGGYITPEDIWRNEKVAFLCRIL